MIVDLLDFLEQVKTRQTEPRQGTASVAAEPRQSTPGEVAEPSQATLCKNNNTAAFGSCAAASPPQLLFLQRVLPGLVLPPHLECSALARLARLLCLASARFALS